MGRLVDRMAEHPLSVFTMTNMYMNEAVDLTKRSSDSQASVKWQDMALTGDRSYDFQVQVASLYGELSKEWQVHQGANAQPVYNIPSVVTLYRADQAKRLAAIIPKAGDPNLKYNYALLNHPYLHSHTMTFRQDYVLKPVFHALAENGRMTVIQGHGNAEGRQSHTGHHKGCNQIEKDEDRIRQGISGSLHPSEKAFLCGCWCGCVGHGTS